MRRRLVLEADLEESRVVALVWLCTHVLEFYKFNICLYKSKLLTLETIGYSWFTLMMSIVVWAQEAVFILIRIM